MNAHSCTHHRVCGDAQVEERFPDFFSTHRRSHRGYEWQVCGKCGDAKNVKRGGNRFNTMPVIGAGEATDDYDRMMNDMYRERHRLTR